MTTIDRASARSALPPSAAPGRVALRLGAVGAAVWIAAAAAPATTPATTPQPAQPGAASAAAGAASGATSGSSRPTVRGVQAPAVQDLAPGGVFVPSPPAAPGAAPAAAPGSAPKACPAAAAPAGSAPLRAGPTRPEPRGATPTPTPVPPPATPAAPAAPAVVAPPSPATAPPTAPATAPAPQVIDGIVVRGHSVSGRPPDVLPLPTLPTVPGASPAGAAGAVAPVPTAPRPAAAPPRPPTKAEIAREIAPAFDTGRDYARLVQCYGTADFMGAVTRVQASRPGANPGIVAAARQILVMQDQMQPMVLAASTVRGEARFRADYDAVARRGQTELASARDPNATLQARLRTLDACSADVRRWRGGR